MSGNRSTAVMQRRDPTSDDRFGPRGFRTSLDYFPTPPWATRAACEFLMAELGEETAMQSVWEPACGEGFMSRPLAEYFAETVASDVQFYGDHHQLFDFTLPGTPAWAPAGWRPDWIFTNPPFQLAGDFVRLGIERANRGVVVFVRGAFTEGDERYWQMFAPEIRPAYVVTYVERVVLLRDRLIRAGAPDPFNLDNGKPKAASSATSYSLIIWMPGQHDTRHRWLPKCRLRLERDGDYPAYSEQWAKIAPERGLLL